MSYDIEEHYTPLDQKERISDEELNKRICEACEKPLAEPCEDCKGRGIDRCEKCCMVSQLL